jgi:AraC-like DNA-binding protein
MMDEVDLSRLSFDLSDTQPIGVILNRHQRLDEGWFDMHYEFELGILLSGKMRRKYLDHERVIGPGELWLCGMWEPHGFELLEVPCELIVFVMDPRYAASSTFLNRSILTPFQLPPVDRPQVSPEKRADLLQMAGLAKKRFEKQPDPDWIKLAFFEIMLTLVENWQPLREPPKFVNAQESIQPSLRLVFEQRRFITTQEAAARCHMSVTGFRTAFQDLMGLSFADFALQYRVRGALAQLKKSPDTLEKVAVDWGFTDASHLHKYIGKADKWVGSGNKARTGKVLMGD